MCPGPDGPTAGREIFSFYWQKKIFGQFASLEAVKFGEKFTPSLCQPDWPPGPGPGSQIQHLSLRVYFFILLWFFLWVFHMYVCAAIFSQEKGKCVDSHTCGYVGGGSTELVVRPQAGTIKMWQIKIPANCQQLSGLWSWDWCLYWCLRSPDGEAVNNIKQNIYLSKLHCCHRVHT